DEERPPHGGAHVGVDDRLEGREGPLLERARDERREGREDEDPEVEDDGADREPPHAPPPRRPRWIRPTRSVSANAAASIATDMALAPCWFSDSISPRT